MAGRNISPNVQTFNVLVDMLCKQGMLKEAEEVLESMIQRGVEPDVFTYNALMNGYCLLGKVDEARRVLELMTQRGVLPNVVTYNSLMNGYCLLKKVDEARRVLELMTQRGVEPNVVTYSSLMNGYCLLGKMDEARRVLELMTQRGVEPNVVTYSSLMNGYCLLGKVDEARRVLDLVTCQGFLQNNDTAKAVELLQVMVDGGFLVNGCNKNLLGKLSDDSGVNLLHLVTRLLPTAAQSRYRILRARAPLPESQIIIVNPVLLEVSGTCNCPDVFFYDASECCPAASFFVLSAELLLLESDSEVRLLVLDGNLCASEKSGCL
ncbi:hypothetical protein LguiB_012681 [Lonicera macranthoides]